MSATGDMIGTALVSGRQAAQAAYAVATKGQKITPAMIAQQQLVVAKSDGAVIDSAIQTAATGTVSGVPPVSIVAAVNVAAGQPVYVDPTSGQLRLASAATFVASAVAGLAQSTTLATFASPLATTTLTLPDWTAVIGTALLAKGARYFLGVAPGTLSLVAPTTPGQSIVSVGIALSTTQLEIDPTPPLLL
jgi:hypothetical protein